MARDMDFGLKPSGDDGLLRADKISRPGGSDSGESSGNTDKNQISLALGSDGYKEMMMERSGLQDRSFVGGQAFESGQALGHVKIDDDTRKESDEYQESVDKPAGEHVTELAGELRDAAQSQRDADQAAGSKKYRNRMAKLDLYPKVMAQLQAQVLETPTLEDDKKFAKLQSRDCDDLPIVQNDGATVEDFMPRSFQKYL